MRFALATAAVAILLSGLPAVADVEWETTSPYYEDDAWYDISEWFDGNDYNPTDEEFGEWDDEVFQYDDDLDNDNDWYYGYDATSTDNDWFYDYYDGTYSYYDYTPDNEFYEFGSRYLDYDNDGTYDAYSTWYDWDNDGYYEDYNYYAFNDQASESQQKRAKEQSPTESRLYQVTGKIRDKKDVVVRNATHIVVSLKPAAETIFADLGPASGIKELHLNKGDQITVTGPKAKVGKAQLVIAQQVTSGDRNIDITRPRRTMEGQVASTHQTKIRGQQHLIALVDTGKKKNLAVDLGPADKLSAQVKKDSTLKFQGVPVKVKDRKMMLAHSVTIDGKQIQIDQMKERPQKDKSTAK